MAQGMTIDASATLAVHDPGRGGVIAELWRRVAPASQERHLVPLALALAWSCER